MPRWSIRYRMHARIERAAARAHRQAVDRREAHGAGHAAPAATARTCWRRCPGAGRRCALRGRAASSCGSTRGDVLVGQAVEAVAAHALRRAAPGAARTSAPARAAPRWNAVSKQATCGRSGRRSSSSRIGARLCGWCSGASGTNCSRSASTAASTRTGCAYVEAAVHDAVADAGQARARRAGRAGSATMCSSAPSWPSAVPSSQACVDRVAPLALLGDEARRGVDALDLAAHREREIVAVLRRTART